MPNVIKIAMLGARGVGKTSLLASIYDQFDSLVQGLHLALTPDHDTSSILQVRLAELKSMGESFVPKGGIQGTQGIKEFIFDLGIIGKSPELRLVFVDFEGGFIGEKPQIVQDILKDSDVVLLALDTPAMMEKRDPQSDNPGGRWHQHVNLGRAITDLLKKYTQQLSGTKLVMIVPVKCESYVQPKQKVPDLILVLEQCYSGILSTFHSDSLLSRIAVVITPVQTLGNVGFSRIEELPSGEPRFHFRRFATPAYAPKDVEEVLMYTLSFSIKKYLDDMSWWQRIFKTTRPFEEAVRKLANRRTEDQTRGFKVVQGHELLKFKD